MTDEPEELDVTQQIKIARAIRAGITPEKVAAHLRVTLAQVAAIAAIDWELRTQEKEFAAWIAANKSERDP